MADRIERHPDYGQQPPEISVEDHGHELVITRRRTPNERLAAVVVPGLWTAAVVWSFVKNGAGEWELDRWLAVSPLIVISLGLFYFGLAYLLNCTRITVGRGFLRIADGPVPWFGNKDLTTDDIEQLEVQKVRRRRGKLRGTWFMLMVRQRSGRETRLLPASQDRAPLRFIERAIEDKLRIEDEFGRKASRTRIQR